MTAKSRFIGLSIAVALGLLPAGAIAQNAAPHWVAAWAASQQSLGRAALTNATVRMIARVTVPGDSVRLRLDNTFGKEPLVIGRAMVAPRIRGAAVASGLNMPVTFDGKGTATIPAGGTMESDPVALHVDAQEDLAAATYNRASTTMRKRPPMSPRTARATKPPRRTASPLPRIRPRCSG